MELKYSPDPVRFIQMTTQEVRNEFLIETLFQPAIINMVYSEIFQIKN